MNSKTKKRGYDKTFTVITVPETFVHIETGTLQKITPEMERFFHKHIEQSSLIDALMTAIFQYVHEDSQAVELERLEGKMDEVLLLLKENKFKVSVSVPKQITNEQIDLPDQLDELLDEFGG